MKIRNQAIAAISAAVIASGSVQADDVQTVVQVESKPISEANNVVIKVTRPLGNIQDYIDAANAERNVNNAVVVDNRSRWEKERAL